MRIDRMLAMVVMLLNRERISARELAEYFDVSVRTVYRDIEAIDMAGIPVVPHSGNQGGFSLMKNFRLDRQLLNLQDMKSILTALKGLNATLPGKDLDQAIGKISNIVPRNQVQNLERLSEDIVLDVVPWGQSDSIRENLSRLHHAINEQRLIEMEYTGAQSDHTLRTVEPMTLIFKGYAWYLFAWCRMRQDYRFFKVSRMGRVESLAGSFTRREGSYQDYTTQYWGNIPGDPTQVTLHFKPHLEKQVREYYTPHQIISITTDYIEVQASFHLDDWMISYLLSQGSKVRVISPPQVIKRIMSEIESMNELYK